MNRSIRVARVLTFVALGARAVAGCSSGGPGSGGGPTTDERTGTIGAQLQLPGGVTVDAVWLDWEVEPYGGHSEWREAAAKRLSGRVLRTPSLSSAAVSVATGADVVLKLENLQVTGAFKEPRAVTRP